MWALITGASSGIGRDMARYLYKMNYNLILVARNEKALYNLKEDLENNDENDKNKFPRVPASFDFGGTPSCGVNKIFPRNAKIASTFVGKASTFSAFGSNSFGSAVFTIKAHWEPSSYVSGSPSVKAI